MRMLRTEEFRRERANTSIESYRYDTKRYSLYVNMSIFKRRICDISYNTVDLSNCQLIWILPITFHNTSEKCFKECDRLVQIMARV